MKRQYSFRPRDLSPVFSQVLSAEHGQAEPRQPLPAHQGRPEGLWEGTEYRLRPAVAGRDPVHDDPRLSSTLCASGGR